MSEPVADLGLDSDVPGRCETGTAVSAVGLGAQDWFLWSRIDGRTTIRELFTMSGQTREATVETLRRLHDHGLIDLPNRERKRPAPPPDPEPEPEPEVDVDELPRPSWFGEYETFVPDPFKMSAASTLTGDMRRLLLYYAAYLERVSYYDLLLVESDASKDTITRAYYRLSKLFHPDRFFRQELGPFEEPLRDVFAWINKAYKTLSGTARRQEYDGLLQRGFVGPWAMKDKPAGSDPQRFTRGETTGHSLGRNALVARGRRLRADRQYKQAASCFRRALALGDDAKLALELVEVQIDGNFDLASALAAARRVAAQAPTNYAARLLEARILKSMGARDDARSVYRAILREQPNHSAARAELKALGDK